MNNQKRFGSMMIDENIFFFISYEDIFPALYKTNLLGNKIECLGEVPWENIFDENGLLGKIDNVIIIAPRWHKNKFLKYDIKLSTFKTILLEQEVWSGDFSTSAFSNVIQFNNSLFFIGNRNGLIVEYNGKDEQFYIHNLIFSSELNKEDLNFFWNSAILKENMIYLPIKKGGLLEVNLKNFRSNYIKIIEDYQCFTMTQINDHFWIIPYYGNKIMLFDLKSKKYNFITLPIEEKIMPFLTMINFGKEVLLIPMNDKFILSINKFNYEISYKKEFELDVIKENERQFLAIYKDINENVYLQKNRSRELWIFNKNGNLKKLSFIIPFENIQKSFEKSKAFKKMFWTENMQAGIDFILQIIKNNEKLENKVYNNHGSNIWRILTDINTLK